MEPATIVRSRQTKRQGTPLHDAAGSGDVDKVRELLEGGKYDVNCVDLLGWTPLHYAALYGHLGVVRMLISEFKADVNGGNRSYVTPFYTAVHWGSSTEAVALALINEFDCNTFGGTHDAFSKGLLEVVQALVHKHGVGILNHYYGGDTPLHTAARHGRKELSLVLINKYRCKTSVKGSQGRSLLHSACAGGDVSLVRSLIYDHKCDVTARDEEDNTPLHVAAMNGSKDVVLALISEFNCSIDEKDHKGRSLLHSACQGGDVQLVQSLIVDYVADVTARDGEDNTPLHVAAMSGSKDVALALISEFNCSIDEKGHKGRSLLHSASMGGDVQLVQSLIVDYKADVTARDGENNTPLHLAALSGKSVVVFALINDFGCDIKVRGHLDRSLLHSAATSYNYSLVKHIRRYISPWVVDSNGDTPLHICAKLGRTRCVQTLLELSPPIMIRNNSDKKPGDVAESLVVEYFDVYMRDNKDKIYSHYKAIQAHAKKKYSHAGPITRVFVIGNPGAGKSSLVETLKREGFLDSFWGRISESSVPLHTAGIVPSIHISRHCGRVLFYDFAGDAEYYSSHAAILENLASSRKGDNIFVIVVDLREEMVKIKTIFHYWLSFIQFQQYRGKKPHLIAVGSHLDFLTKSEAKAKGKELQTLCDSTQNLAVSVSAYFMLDCCKPRSKQITDIQNLIATLTKDSPHHKLSFEANLLLGLLEKDFSNVLACPIKDLLTHIEETGLPLTAELEPLYAVLLELHDLGLLFIIDSSNREDLNLVLNMSQLTNIVHKSLFSEEANVRLREIYGSEGLSFYFSAGVIPQSILAKILPKKITKECLVQLQYCQEISNTDVHAFPSLTPPESTNQSFLFFPALCSADKSEVAWVTPPDLSYGIGWLARCTDLWDYFPPRFLHVLLLRLVFRFAQPNQVWSGSPDHTYFQRRCTMWKTGVHWLMEEGVECMVELGNANKEVAVLTKSIRDRAENCATVFNSIITCVMEAKAEFCHSVKLEFFLLDSTDEADCHNADNLFAMRDVERVLTSPEGREVIVSVSGKGQMKRSKLLCLCIFTHWYSLFPIDFASVLDYLKGVVTELYMLGLHLDIPKGILDALKVDYPTDVERWRRELVKGWMSSSLDPPCWWHLIRALRETQHSVLAEEIKGKYYPQIQLQEKLLDRQNHHLRPDVEFLTSFADVVGSKWSSLAASLSLSESEIEQVKGEGLTTQDHALKMLRKWVTKEGSTYGQLYKTLNTIYLANS